METPIGDLHTESVVSAVLAHNARRTFENVSSTNPAVSSVAWTTLSLELAKLYPVSEGRRSQLEMLTLEHWLLGLDEEEALKEVEALVAELRKMKGKQL